MRKIQLIGLALFAVFAFSAVMAASAFAETNMLWLVNGNEILTGELLPTETTGLLTLTTLLFGSPVVSVHCEGTFDGSVGPNGEDEITEVLNTAKELINQLGEAPELALSCEVVAISGTSRCVVGSLAELWPVNLPWHTQIELMAAGSNEWLDHLFGGGANKEPGYMVLCLNSSGGNEENTCEGLTSSRLENMPAPESDVLGIFGLAAETEPSEKCTTPFTEGDIEGEGLIFLTSGLPLSVSEP
jgi:hypothetical protein